MTPGDGIAFSDFLARKYPVDRLFAWLIDWLVILAWVAIVAAIGVPLFLGGDDLACATGDDRQALPPASRRG